MPDALRHGPRRTAGHLAVALRRSSALRRRRWAICATLLVAGVVLGGSGGVLLGLTAGVLALDALIPMPGTTVGEADDRFWRLVRRRARSRRWRRLRGRPPETLELVDDRRGPLSVAARRDLGVLPIPLRSITGTIEGAKAASFDGAFRPDPSSRSRWVRLWLAQAHDAPLPPISVFRVEGRHVVRDGHHRVSVARDHGRTTIDAEVVELVARRGRALPPADPPAG